MLDGYWQVNITSVENVVFSFVDCILRTIYSVCREQLSFKRSFQNNY